MVRINSWSLQYENDCVEGNNMSVRKTFARILRLPALLRGLKEGGENWFLLSRSELDAYQLTQLNNVWRDAVENIPFYADWKVRHNLPDQISSLEDYAKWPILKKSELQANPELLKRKTTRKHHENVTGGSTGEPLHFSTFPEQGQRVNASILMARAGLDFYPGDRVFLFWGHRHFYGHGMKAKVRFFVRRCKDWLNNSYRADACDLSPRYLYIVGKKLNQLNPEVVIAYSASLLAFVRFAKEKGLPFTGNKLKCIVCTAGPLMKLERDEVASYFCAPVYMEYGAMDAGCMAYMQKDGRYHVFQHYRMLHTINDGTGDLNLVTTLAKDYLPFFRYQVGDYLKDCTYTPDGRVLTIGEVYGRGSDVIILPSGNKCQCYTFMVCAEEIKKVLAYQLVKHANSFDFCVQVSEPLTQEERGQILERAYSIIPELRNVEIKIVEKEALVKAPSGKIRLLVEEK